MTSYRSILLECDIAKHHHKFLRSKLIVAIRLAGVAMDARGARSPLLDSHCEGVKHKGTERLQPGASEP